MDNEDKKKNSLQGFKTLKLRYSATSTTFHELFIKEHSVRNQSADKPIGRTLFILNVPQYITENSFKKIFRTAGPVKSVLFQAKPSSKSVSEIEGSLENISGFKVAYVVFTQAAGLSKALELESLPPLAIGNSDIVTGLEKWVKEYNSSIHDSVSLQKEVDLFMKHYDKEEDTLKQKGKPSVDDEGWTTVTKHSRKPGVARKESVNNKLLDRIKTGKKQKELKNFYTFQIRESKQNKIVELRKKYEEDKLRISKMKQARKFKPY